MYGFTCATGEHMALSMSRAAVEGLVGLCVVFAGRPFTSLMGTVRLPALLVAALAAGREERSGDARGAGTVAGAANGTRRAVCCCTGRAATGCRARGAGGGSGTGTVATLCSAS